MSNVIAIDAGNYMTKFFDGKRVVSFPSVIGFDWRERNLKQQQGEHDYEWEYNGHRGFAGTLAMYESETAEARKGDSKAHIDAQLRVLIALHQYCPDSDCRIVVGQPIKTHTQSQKEAIKQLLSGRHEITVNGQRRVIIVRRCEVAAEGVTAGLLVAGAGIARVIDIGSGTVNFGTLIDRRFNDKGSFTLTAGLETLRNNDPASFARQIALKAFAGGWQESDAVYLCGGGAEPLREALRAYFPHIQTIEGDPVYANVRAFWLVASKLYAGG